MTTEPMPKSESASEIVLSNLSTAILVLSDGHTIVFANQAAENLLKESASQMAGQRLIELIINGEELAEIVREAAMTNKTFTRRRMQLLLVGKDNFTADVTITPVLEKGQTVVELIPMDRYLRIDRDAAIQEHHDVTRQMVRELAHEIKNPLGGIKGSAELLARELPDKSLEEYTDIIIQETNRLTSLLDRMLGPNTLAQKIPMSIHQVLERTANLIELESKSLEVIRDYDPSIPELFIDPELMLQAVLNVARNAMQILARTSDPAMTFTTRIERQFTINGQRHKVVVRVDIKDNGPGVASEIQEQLFYPMISRRPGGTGLGLNFAQSIIAQHNGMIEFESEPGDTTFSIIIPLEQSNE
jgi:two-component system nitrogen regulation sensor histidine kinase GlnL